VGLLLIAPQPRLNRGAFGVLIRRCALGLLPPALLVTGVVTLVHTGAVSSASPPALRILTLGIWWGAWLLAAANGCRILASLGPDLAAAPSLYRSIAGATVLTAIGVITAAVLLVFGVTDNEFDVGAVISSVLLFALGITLAGTIHELPTLTDDDEDATRA
jgi:hypothetical protein